MVVPAFSAIGLALILWSADATAAKLTPAYNPRAPQHGDVGLKLPVTDRTVLSIQRPPHSTSRHTKQVHHSQKQAQQYYQPARQYYQWHEH
jgi:hypothetical protein